MREQLGQYSRGILSPFIIIHIFVPCCCPVIFSIVKLKVFVQDLPYLCHCWHCARFNVNFEVGLNLLQCDIMYAILQKVLPYQFLHFLGLFLLLLFLRGLYHFVINLLLFACSKFESLHQSVHFICRNLHFASDEGGLHSFNLVQSDNFALFLHPLDFSFVHRSVLFVQK